MTTSEQAALLAKHHEIVGLNQFTPGSYCFRCLGESFPCDVHRMAELKDAEIAEHVLRAASLRAEVRRLEEELKLDDAEIAGAVSEAVERIVEALEKMRPKTRECAASSPVFTGYDDAMADAILILRSRDWSKGERE